MGTCFIVADDKELLRSRSFRMPQDVAIEWQRKEPHDLQVSSEHLTKQKKRGPQSHYLRKQEQALIFRQSEYRYA